MQKRILIGSVITIFLLILLPLIPAIEFNTIIESNKSYFFEKIQSINTEELRERFWKPGKFLALFWWILFLFYISLDPNMEGKYPLFLLTLMIIWFILFIISGGIGPLNNSLKINT